jgi:hypothetical protein
MCWNLVQETEGDRVLELDALATRLDKGLPARPRQFVRVPVPQHATAVLLQDGHGDGAAAVHTTGNINKMRSLSDIWASAKTMTNLISHNDAKKGDCTAGALTGWKDALKLQENRGPLAPVACLDQLLSQASGVDRLVRAKIQTWGVRAGAHYRLAGTHSHVVAFEPWADLQRYPEACSGDGSNGRVRWARVKSRLRAVEKLYRVYRLDVSMLVSVLRHLC